MVQHPHLPTTVDHSRHPLGGTDFACGGKARADAHGQAAAGRETLRFLDQTFARGEARS